MSNTPDKTKPDISESMQNQLIEFKIFLELEQGSSKNTIDSYMRDIKQLCSYLNAVENVKNFEDVVLDNIVNWINLLSKQTRTSTQARKMSALRALNIHLLDEKIWKTNFGEYLSRPKITRLAPKVVSINQIQKLIETPNLDKFESIRDYAMLELMYGSGLRVSEICDLKFVDIDLKEAILRVRGKGDKQRLIPIGDYAINAIKQYLYSRLEQKKNSAAELFITKRGSKLSRKTFWRNLKMYASNNEDISSIKPHTLRHCFATHLLQNGANLLSIKEMLGHSDLSTTQIYTQLLDETIQKEHSLAHPRKNMKIDDDV